VIELIEGQWFNPYEIVSVKSISKDKCVLWTTGQPSTEGHVLEFPAEEVVQAIEDAIEEIESEEVDDEDADQNEE
jgi:hypothetical protein